ncbi:CEP19-like protein-domain-containing protein [Dunaliella salina]|uniref:Centrosomal protein of 19 kDa n=1 Tax=Dunaliella salina TaxID=3046 RepID=A0ABQ7G449_DUNSA|nr:CEP19-like protein-domain-containing protein [Dunaliella salina]|eukprot:KAF5829394.1 CEP19-like protein-domain-containing protein [Dunaliella salina]
MPALDVSAKRSNSEYVEDASKYAYTAKRFAIKFQPPCLFLEYNEVKTQKTRVRAVKITELSTDMDLDRLTRKVRKLVSKLVERLQAAQQGTFARPNDLALPKDAALRSPEMPEPGQGGVSPFLQALRGSREVGKDVARDSTESHFSVSDVGSSREPNGKHRHEDLDEAMLQLDRELASDNERRAGNDASSKNSNSRHGQPPQMRSSSAAPSSHVEAAVGQVPQQSNGSRFKQQEADEEMLTLDIDINEDTDLNRVSEMELRLAKQQMEREFTKHQLKPGEPGYEYDKQIEFGPPTSANDWDDDDDD